MRFESLDYACAYKRTMILSISESKLGKRKEREEERKRKSLIWGVLVYFDIEIINFPDNSAKKSLSVTP